MFENLWKQLLALDVKNKFTLKEKIFFLKELSFLLDWWIPVIESISSMKENNDNQSVINMCDIIYNSLNKWENLSRSMSRVGKKFFSEWDINIIKSGENSWEVPKVLRYLSNEYEFLKTIKWKYVSAISYPLIG
jgi:type II secretory pathway component PulF